MKQALALLWLAVQLTFVAVDAGLPLSGNEQRANSSDSAALSSAPQPSSSSSSVAAPPLAAPLCVAEASRPPRVALTAQGELQEMKRDGSRASLFRLQDARQLASLETGRFAVSSHGKLWLLDTQVNKLRLWVDPAVPLETVDLAEGEAGSVWWLTQDPVRRSFAVWCIQDGESHAPLVFRSPLRDGPYLSVCGTEWSTVLLAGKGGRVIEQRGGAGVTRTPVKELPLQRIRMEPDGQLIALASGQLWCIDPRGQLRQLQGVMGGSTTHVSAHPRSRTLHYVSDAARELRLQPSDNSTRWTPLAAVSVARPWLQQVRGVGFPAQPEEPSGRAPVQILDQLLPGEQLPDSLDKLSKEWGPFTPDFLSTRRGWLDFFPCTVQLYPRSTARPLDGAQCLLYAEITLPDGEPQDALLILQRRLGAPDYALDKSDRTHLRRLTLQQARPLQSKPGVFSYVWPLPSARCAELEFDRRFGARRIRVLLRSSLHAVPAVSISG